MANPDTPPALSADAIIDAFLGLPYIMLWGDPADSATDIIKDRLDGERIAYSFQPDEYLARPVLQLEAGQFVGKEECLRAIGFFLLNETSAVS